MSVTTLARPVAASRLLRQCRAALGDSALRLQEEPLAILKGLYRLGSLVVTTFGRGGRVSQNMHYPALQESEPWLENVGAHCRLRQSLQVELWHSIVAVLEPVGDLPARSLVFFDDQGQPVQQVAVAPESGGLAFEELVCAMLHPDQSSVGPQVPVAEPRSRPLPVSAAERLWSQADEEAFADVLARCGDNRASLYRAVRDSFAYPVAPELVATVLNAAAKQAASTTLCLGNRGVRLCLTAPWSSPQWQGDQCHLAHGGALLSLDYANVGSVWRLRRPGRGQIVTALEVLDAEGRWLWTLSAGSDGEAAWRALLASCAPACSATA